jgi:hypothetical protein
MTNESQVTLAGQMTLPFVAAERCRACGASIRWARDEAGERIAVDANTGNAHWSTCPNDERLRKEEP